MMNVRAYVRAYVRCVRMCASATHYFRNGIV